MSTAKVEELLKKMNKKKPKEKKPEKKPEQKKETKKPEPTKKETKQKKSLLGILKGKSETKPTPIKELPPPPPEQKTIPETIPTETKSIPVSQPTEDAQPEFDFSEETEVGSRTFMIYGEKGTGKTFLSFTFPGTIACLSFDHQSVLIKDQFFKKDNRIKVFDAVRYNDRSSPQRWLESSVKTFDYINELLKRIITPEKPDWIVIDGYHIYHTIAEMVMRARNNKMPFEGIANPNIWKERRMYIWQLHKLAMDACKKGVIYTTYTVIKKILKDGLEVQEEIPKWIDIIMHETNTVIKTTSGQDTNNQRRFYATVESSKIMTIPTSGKIDVTKEGIKALLKGEL